jgi:hypothetical protein
MLTLPTEPWFYVDFLLLLFLPLFISFSTMVFLVLKLIIVDKSGPPVERFWMKLKALRWRMRSTISHISKSVVSFLVSMV